MRGAIGLSGLVFWLIVLAWSGQILSKDIESFPETLSLEQALAMLDESHPDLMQVEAKVLSSRASGLQLDADNALGITFEGELRQVDRQIPRDHDFADDSRVRLVVDKQFTDFGISATQRQGIESGISAAQEMARLAHAENRIQIIRAFCNVIISDYAYIVADEQMTVAYLRFNNLREKMEKFGEAAEVQVVALESIYLDKLAARTAANHVQRNRRLRLALALNRPEAYPDKMIEPDTAGYDRPLPDYEVLLEQVMENSLELGAARLHVESARKYLAATRLTRPVLGLRLEATEYSEVLSGNRDELRSSLYLKVPLYNALHYEAETARNYAAVVESEATRAQLEHEIRLKVLELVQQLANIKAEIEASRAELYYRELELDKTRLEYEMEIRANIGDANAKVAGALYRNIKAEYAQMLVWEQIDALRRTYSVTNNIP